MWPRGITGHGSTIDLPLVYLPCLPGGRVGARRLASGLACVRKCTFRSSFVTICPSHSHVSVYLACFVSVQVAWGPADGIRPALPAGKTWGRGGACPALVQLVVRVRQYLLSKTRRNQGGLQVYQIHPIRICMLFAMEIRTLPCSSPHGL